VALFVWVVLAAPARAAECPNADAPYTPWVNEVQVRSAVLCLVNHERVTRGLRPVKAVAALDLAASRHLADMAARGYVGHVAPVPAPYGATPGQRAVAAGYPGPLAVGAPGWDVGETLSVISQPVVNTDPGLISARSVMGSWMESAGHCATLLTREMEHFGMGLLSTPSPGWVTTSMALLMGGIAQRMTPLDGCPFTGLVAPNALPAPRLPAPAPTAIARGATGGVIAGGEEINLARGARAIPLTVRCRAATTSRGVLSVRARGRMLASKTVAIARGTTRRVWLPVARKLRKRLLRRTTRAPVRLDIARGWAAHAVLLRGEVGGMRRTFGAQRRRVALVLIPLAAVFTVITASEGLWILAIPGGFFCVVEAVVAIRSRRPRRSASPPPAERPTPQPIWSSTPQSPPAGRAPRRTSPRDRAAARRPGRRGRGRPGA
jgi:uncharacterized protein YkwD